MSKALEVREGVEVSVETGLGWITKVDPPKGRNASVTIKAEHLNLDVTSWVDTADLKLYNAVLTAHAEARRIGYRIVVKRKRGQDDSLPLDAIPNLYRVRDLEHIEVMAGGQAPAAPTASNQEPQGTAPVAPQGPPSTPPAPEAAEPPSAPAAGAVDGAGAGPACGLCGQSLAGGGPVRKVLGVLQHVECPGLEELTRPPERTADAPGPITTGRVPDPVPPAPPPPPAARAPQPRVQEAKPWEFYNSDGSINPGSYAYGAAEGMVLLASELLLDRARRATEGAFQAPSQGQIKGLARRLLRAADLAQAALRDDGHISRMASSHTRSRSAVRSALQVYPVPWGATPDELEAWVYSLADHAGGILAITVSLIDPEPI